MELLLLRLSASYTAIPDHVHTIEDALPTWAKTPMTGIGLAEALGNAIVHGILQLTPRSEETNLMAWLDELLARDAGEVGAHDLLVIVHVEDDRATVVINDGGPGFDWHAAERRPHRGLGIMSASFDSVAWNEEGNVVALSVQGRVA